MNLSPALEKKILLALLFCYICLRFSLIHLSLWIDEGVTYWFCKVPFSDVINLLIKMKEIHPPGYFLFMNLWTKLFGFSELTLRLPSILIGIPGGYFLYLLSKKLKDSFFALWVLFFYVFSLTIINFQVYARMYPFLCTFFIVELYLLHSALNDEKNRKRILFVWAILNGISLYFHYFGIFIFLGQVIIWITLNIKQKDTILKFIPFTIIPVLLFLPFLFFLYPVIHASFGIHDFFAENRWAVFINDFVFSIVYFFNGEQPANLPFIFPLLQCIIILLSFIFAYRALEKKSYIIFSFSFAIPYICIFVTDLFRHTHLFQYFYLALFAPIMFSLLAAVILMMPKSIRYIIFSAFIVINLTGVFRYATNTAYGYGDWRSIIKNIDSRMEKNDAVFMEMPMTIPMFKYYSIHSDNLRIDNEFYEKKPEKIKERYDRLWLVFLLHTSRKGSLDTFYNQQFKILETYHCKNFKPSSYIISILYSVKK